MNPRSKVRLYRRLLRRAEDERQLYRTATNEEERYAQQFQKDLLEARTVLARLMWYGDEYMDRHDLDLVRETARMLEQY